MSVRRSSPGSLPRGIAPHVFAGLLSAVLGCRSAPEPPAITTPALASPGLTEGAEPSGGAHPVDALPRAAAQTPAPRLLDIGGGQIRVALPAELEPSAPQLLAWIERCARATAGYYARFPVPVLELEVRWWPGAGIRGGQTLPTSPPIIRVSVGGRTSPAQYEDNWSLTHEMVHLAFPNVPSAHHWIEEGLATYVEPIARARAGWIAEEAVWAEWIENMPLGLPAPGDRGLDGTESWGRTYWGGALFCLLADIEIRKRSQGRHELDDALRALVAAGASVSRRWSLERALQVGDQATRTTALADTYRAMKDRAAYVDLDTLWKDLGVEVRAGRVVFVPSAPLAVLRSGIVAGAR